jgi:hypothetical protein
MSASPANTGISLGGNSILAVVMTRGNEENPLDNVYRVAFFSPTNNTLRNFAIETVSKLSYCRHIALHEKLPSIPAKRAARGQALFPSLC